MDISKRMENRRLFDEVKAIADMYFYALSKLKKRYGYISDSDRTNNEYISYVAKVRYAFHSLSDIEQVFINNEFFYEAYPEWWKPVYTRSTFYRIRNKSMRHFKEAVDNAY